MSIRSISGAFGVAAAVCMLAAGAQAASISVEPDSTTVVVGNTVSLSIVADFTDEPTIGGGFDVFFDSAALAFVSFEFLDAAVVGDDPDFRREPDQLDGELNGIGFGDFDGWSGPATVAVIVFQALEVGPTSISLGINEGGPPDQPGPFYPAAGGIDPQAVSFNGAQIDVAAVPIPAGFVLLGSALLAVGGLRRRRQ